jgi:hypothetical protein
MSSVGDCQSKGVHLTPLDLSAQEIDQYVRDQFGLV